MDRIRRVLFLGSKRLGIRLLEEMYKIDQESIIGIITIDDRKDSRNVFNDLSNFSYRNNIDFRVSENRLNSEQLIRQFEPQLCIIAGWYWLISNETLKSIPYGSIGFHNSLLPKYRGGSPLVWTMINGDKIAGVSLFSLTNGLDEGDIWAQKSVKIKHTDYISDVLNKLEGKAVSILRENYLNILNNCLKPFPQNPKDATFCAQRYPNDGMIDWEKSANEIYNFIRAQSEPYPGAFTFLGKKKLTIWRAQLEESIYYGTPGQVARINDNGVYVICGDNKPIILEVVQLDLKKELANRIIKSNKIRFPIKPNVNLLAE